MKRAHRLQVSLIIIVCLLAFVWQPASALNSLSGFPLYDDDIPQRIYVTPVVIDVDMDGSNEIVCLGSDNNSRVLLIIDDDGTVNSYTTAPDGYCTSPPAVGDLDNDGDYEIVYGTGEGKLYAKDASGNDVSGFPVTLNSDKEIKSSPLLADVDGDGDLEIAVGVFDLGTNFFLVSHTGSILWSTDLEGSVVGSPAIGDGDGDFSYEIYIGTRCDYVREEVGRIYCLSSSNGNVEWSHGHGDEYSFETPAVGDIDWDGDLEVVIPHHHSWRWDPENPQYCGWFYAYDGDFEGSAPLWTYQVNHWAVAVSLGDIVSDSTLEILGSCDQAGGGSPQGDAVFCLEHDGDRRWSLGTGNGVDGSNSQCALGDFYEDATAYDVAFNAWSDTEPAFFLVKNDGSIYDDLPEVLDGPYTLSPYVFDLDTDGEADVAITSEDNVGEQKLRVEALDFAYTYDSTKVEWWGHQRDERNTGLHAQPVKGTINTDCTWWGRVVVWDTVIVASDRTLRLQPGTEVFFRPNTIIRVQGEIKALGWKNRKVLFTSSKSSPSAGDYKGIQLEKESKGLFENCNFEYATVAIYADSTDTVAIDSCSFKDISQTGVYVNVAPTGAHIKYSKFNDCDDYGIRVVGGSPVIYDNELEDCQYGVYYSGTGKPIIGKNTIRIATVDILNPPYYGVYTTTNTGTNTPKIDSCKISGYSLYGIYMKNASCSSWVKAVTCSSNTNGMLLDSASPDIVGISSSYFNSISYNDSLGLVMVGSSSPDIMYLKVKHNEKRGVHVGGTSTPDFDPCEPGQNGNNSLCYYDDNDPGISTRPNWYYDLYNNTQNTIDAEGSWWGDSTNYWNGSDPYIHTTQTVDYRPRAGSDPLSGYGGSWRIGAVGPVPVAYHLGQNYPNPFNAVTVIPYSVASAGQVSLQIYNLRGQLVRSLVDSHAETGEHLVRWDGNDDGGQRVASGVYFYRLETEHYSKTKKLVLLK